MTWCDLYSRLQWDKTLLLLFHKHEVCFLFLVQVWYNNVPHTRLVEDKGGQNWISRDKDKFKFPGGGTQFIHGANEYLDHISKVVMVFLYALVLVSPFCQENVGASYRNLMLDICDCR